MPACNGKYSKIPRDAERHSEKQERARAARPTQEIRKRHGRHHLAWLEVNIAGLGLPWLRSTEWPYWLDDFINCEPRRTKEDQGAPRSAKDGRRVTEAERRWSTANIE